MNNIPKIENNELRGKKGVQSNDKKEIIADNLVNALSNKFSKDDADRDKVDISYEQKSNDYEDLKENKDNEDSDITRRKRRRSSAGND